MLTIRQVTFKGGHVDKNTTSLSLEKKNKTKKTGYSLTLFNRKKARNIKDVQISRLSDVIRAGVT